jgi:hypothetical protein
MIYADKQKLIKKQSKNYFMQDEKQKMRLLFSLAPASLRFAFLKDKDRQVPIVIAEGFTPYFKTVKFKVVGFHFFIKLRAKEGTIVLPFCPFAGGDTVLQFAKDNGYLLFRINDKETHVNLSHTQLFEIGEYLRKLYWRSLKDVQNPECFYCATAFLNKEEAAQKEVDR